MNIRLASGVEIGNGKRPFIIAEVGSNWATFEDCKTSIAMAKNCGADAVKFQAFSCQALYGFERRHSMDYEGLAGVLPIEWLPKLKEKADACGIEFMCTAFSPELIEAVDPFVNIHKNASAELTHVRMLQTYSRIGKPVILSTGGHWEYDVRRALEVLGSTPTILMYCVAAYPARLVELDTIGWMRSLYRKLIGFSDHTTDVLVIPRAAIVEHSACVIEKHVNFAGVQSPDSPHSLDTGEFMAMVKNIRGTYTPVNGPGAEENAMTLKHNRRLKATRDVKCGEAWQEGINFGIYRSLEDDCYALSPWAVDVVNGRKAKRDVKAGAGVGSGDI